MLRSLLLWTMLTGGLAGCADPFADAEKANTVAAWEAYLATKPSGSRLLKAEDSLRELLLAKANASDAVEDYDAVLQRFPNAREKKDIQGKRWKAALKVAEAENSEEGWAKFMKENSFADAPTLKAARARVEMAAYAPNLVISEPVVKQVNLADDPKGPLNGWGFACEVTNNGPKSVKTLKLEVQLVDDAGKLLRAFQYPVVAGTYPSGQAADEAFAAPILPGGKRGWSYTTDDIPEGWTQKVKVVPFSIATTDPAP